MDRWFWLFFPIPTVFGVRQTWRLDPFVSVSQPGRGDALARLRAQWGHESSHLEPVSSPQPARTAVTSEWPGRSGSVGRHAEEGCVICSILRLGCCGAAEIDPYGGVTLIRRRDASAKSASASVESVISHTASQTDESVAHKRLFSMSQTLLRMREN